MTPRVPRSAIYGVGLLIAAVTLTGALSRSVSAQESTDLNTPVTLAGQTVAERMQQLRDEYKERQHEIREAIEARKHPKRAHGRKVEPAFNDDYAGPQAASKFGFPTTFSTPTNTKANDKTGDGAGAGQAEQSPVFVGQNGLCEWNDGQGFVINPTNPPFLMGYGWSTNGGASWTDGGVAPSDSANTLITRWASDPSVTANEKTGDFYMTSLTANSGVNNNGVAVLRGHFAGGTFVWDAVKMAASAPSSVVGFDKEWMAADSLTGNLYETYTGFTATGDGINLVRSTDNGATWSAPIVVSRTWENGRVQGSRPMIGPNGEVYVIYSAIGSVDADSIKITRSTDGGLTFGPSYVAMTEYTNYFTGAPGFNRPRAVTFPSGAVDRSTGPTRRRVYMTIQDAVDFYADPIGGGTSKSEVEQNSGFANATPFTVGQTLRGTISSVSDQDWWSFPATQGTTYIFFADSVRTTSFRYQMRLYCPNDTTVLSRLAESGNASTTDGVNQHALIVWTAPSTNTYYLRMVEVSSTGGYRIRSGTHTPNANDVARDARDVAVASSGDVGVTWTPRQIVNDDAANTDDWLPEVAVPCDGNPYVYWFDFRDFAASCFGGSNIRVTRSLNGGATWSGSKLVSDVGTPNWTHVASNIAPNQGDYNGFYGGDALAFAFADGRLGDADVFTARVPIHAPVTGCPNDQVAVAGSTVSGSVQVSNGNVLFDNTYNYTVSTSVIWPGNPTSGNVLVFAGTNGNIPFSVTVPDTAADGEVVHVCVTASQNGACVDQCCFNLTVSNPVVPTLMSLFDATAGSNGGVDLSWSAQSSRSIVGWNLYRGTSPTTIVDRVNAQTIPVSSSGNYAIHDDSNVGGTVYYRLTAVTANGVEVEQGTTQVMLAGGVPHAFAVALAGPNPFRGRTALSVALPSSMKLSVDVFNIAGQKIQTVFEGPANAGFYTLPLSFSHSGVYLVSVKAGANSKIVRVTSLQ